MKYLTDATLEQIKPKTPSTNRIEILDILRGITLFGILMIHSYTDFNSIYELVSESYVRNMTHSVLNLGMSKLFSHVLYSIFSFLFGLSMAIQLRNAASKEQPFTKRFIWRMTVLLVIGYFHSLFFSRDILQLYALLGMLLVLFKDIQNKGLLLTGSILTLLGIGMKFFNSELTLGVAQLGEWSREITIMRIIGLSKIEYLILTGRLFVVFSLFVWGLYAGKNGLFTKMENNRKFFTNLLIWSGGLTFFLGSMYLITKRNHIDLPDYVNSIYTLERMAQSTFYVAMFVKLYEIKVFQRIGDLFVPVGKMGLTIYVSQSLFLIFYYTLDTDLILELGVEGALASTISFFILQMLFAWSWMSVFRYGPLEWVWRSLTYLKLFPILKIPA